MADPRTSTDRISAQAVALMHTQDRLANDYCETAYSIKLQLLGEIHGLRWALCVLKGWDPAEESGRDEKADGYLRVWHNLPGHCAVDDCGPW